MATLILHICDYCKTESRELPENWQKIVFRKGNTAEAEYQDMLACSLKCFIHLVADKGVDSIAINNSFMVSAQTEFDQLTLSVSELKAQLESAKIKPKGGVNNRARKPGIGKEVGQKRR